MFESYGKPDHQLYMKVILTFTTMKSENTSLKVVAKEGGDGIQQRATGQLGCSGEDTVQ